LATVKTLLRDWMPPIAVRAYRGLVPAAKPALEFTGAYPTWAAAFADCGEGYQAPEPVEREAAITRRLIESPHASLSSKDIKALAGILSCGTVRSVLDFGGGLGQHFLNLNPHLGTTNWVVCETEAMAKRGNESFARPGLEFIWSLDAVAGRRFDVCFASGALQAVPDPGAVLESLSKLASHVVISRLPLTSWAENRLKVATIREGDSRWACPLWFFSETWWLGQLERLGLKIKLRWGAPDETIAIDGQPCEFQGMALVKELP
jgi:putative methyltransferase (TIGR04325 family)